MILDAPDSPPSGLLTWGPWFLIFAVGSAIAVVYARRAVLRRGDARAARWLVGASVFGTLALLDLIGLFFSMRNGKWDSLLPASFASLLIFFVLGTLGCGGYTIWRMICTVAPRTPSDPPAA